MTIVVCIKQVGVLGDEVAFTDDGSALDPDYLDPALNEWDGYALEEALRLRDSVGGDVVAITLGGDEAEAVLRRALAMGVDRAIRVDLELDQDALAPARALAPAIRAESPALVLCGAKSSDLSLGATPAALAGLLGTPIAAVVRTIDVDDGLTSAVVHRELEGGSIDVVEVDLPAVVSVQTGINQPRYATLRAIRAAEEHEIAIVHAELESSTRVRQLRTPARSHQATMLDGGSAEIARRIVGVVRERLG